LDGPRGNRCGDYLSREAGPYEMISSFKGKERGGGEEEEESRAMDKAGRHSCRGQKRAYSDHSYPASGGKLRRTSGLPTERK